MNKYDLRKNAKILYFLATETGFLFGKKIFIGMENSHITTVLTGNNVPSSDIEKALYEIEYHFNLLGLELKQNPNISSDIVAQKIYNAYDPELEFNADYNILFEGELVVDNLENDKVTTEEISPSKGNFLDEDNDTVSFTSNNKQEDELPNATAKPYVVEEPPIVYKQPVVLPSNQNAPSGAEEELELKASVFPPLYRLNEPIKVYLKDRGVSDVIINWVLFKRAQNAVRFAESPQEIVDRIEKKPKFIGKTSVLEKALSSMMNDSPLSLTGGAGSGKTTLVETVSSLLNMPLFTVNGSLEANKATLVGEKDLNKYRQIVARDGQQTKAMLVGGLLYIDEFNMIRPDVLAILNPAMDDRRAFFNDVSRKTIYGHKEFRVITAMNVGYTGVKKMNEATMERLGAIVLTYMGKIEMKLMLESVAAEQNSLAKQEGIPQLQKADIVNITDIYLEMTSASVQGLVPALAASPRNSKLLAKHIPILGYQYALEMMLDKFEPNEQAQIVGVLDKDDFFDSIGVDSTALLNRK